MVVHGMLRWRCPPLLILLVLLISWIPELYNQGDLDYVEYMAGIGMVAEKCAQAAWTCLQPSLRRAFQTMLMLMKSLTVSPAPTCTFCRGVILFHVGC